MELHPEERVARFIEEHEHALAAYQGYLDLVVPKVFAMFEEAFPDPHYIPGDALCSAVRALLWNLAEQSPQDAHSLAPAKRPPASKQLTDGDGTTIRIRRHPWDYKICARARITEPPVDTLFGTDYSLPYELAILWSPSFSTKSLGSATLSAVFGLDTPKVSIYHSEPLPLADTLSERARLAFAEPAPSADDFGEFFNDESVGDIDPA